MKSIFNVVFTLILIVLSSYLISCQHDDYDRHNERIQSQEESFVVKVESGKHFQYFNPKIYQKLEKAKSFNLEKERTEYGSFILDVNTIQIIERNTYTQYTTPVLEHNEQETHLINYMLLVFDDGAEYQFLIKYPYIISDENIMLDHVNARIEAINGDTLFNKSGIGNPRPCLDSVPVIVDTVQQYICETTRCTGGERHVWGEECPCVNLSNCTMPTKTCGWQTVNVWGCSGGSTGSGSNAGSASGGSINSPNDTDDDPVETVPIIADWKQIESCFNTFSLNDTIELNMAMISWLEINNSQVARAMNTMLKEYLCSSQAQEDILVEINMLMEHELTEVDFDHFAVDEIDNDCLLRVVRDEIIISLNAGIINQIRNTIGQQPNYILGFRDNNILNGIANAGTSIPSASAVNNGQYPIIVNFAEDYLANNPTKLSLAANAIHEMVHAHLIYLYLEGQLLQKYPSFTDLKSKFDIYIDSRTEVNRIALEDSMHIAMVDLIGTMAYALYKYAKDNSMINVTHEYCKDVTKGTFSGTPAMNIITPDVNLQNDYILKAYNEQNNTSDAKGKDC